MHFRTSTTTTSADNYCVGLKWTYSLPTKEKIHTAENGAKPLHESPTTLYRAHTEYTWDKEDSWEKSLWQFGPQFRKAVKYRNGENVILPGSPPKGCTFSAHCVVWVLALPECPSGILLLLKKNLPVIKFSHCTWQGSAWDHQHLVLPLIMRHNL